MPLFPRRQRTRRVRHPHLGLLAGGLLALLMVSALLAGDYGWSRARLFESVDVPESQTVHFQYQDLDFQEAYRLPVSVLVIDPDDSGLTSAQVSLLKQRPDGSRRLVLAYLSVGEAEDYRDYWGLNWRPGYPSFVEQANPDWPGNFKVRYWDWRWHRVMADEAARLAGLGYDGAYLDVIDAYEYWQDRGLTGTDGKMISLVKKVKGAARAVNPDFLVIPQNSPELYGQSSWRNLVDGLGKEDTWFAGGRRRDPAAVAEDVQWLDLAKADGKPILAIDYPTANGGVCDFYRMCQAKGYACVVSDLALDLPEPVECLK